jgi:alpha-D-xyloside xylohydrolase
MRPLFYDFPEDAKAWELEDEYMFGPDVLIAPILYAGQRERSVYLPDGSWKNLFTGETFEGGQTYQVDAPLEYIPVFVRNNREF